LGQTRRYGQFFTGTFDCSGRAQAGGQRTGFFLILGAVALVGREAISIAILTIFTVSRVAAQDALTMQSEPVIVSAPMPSEESLIAENQQPAWTAHRRFTTTRIYVLPAWQVKF